MTLQQLIDAITAVCSDTWELALPKGLQRGVVWHNYGVVALKADDRTVFRVKKVQLDLLWRSPDDTLLADVLEILDDNLVAYRQEDAFYDESYERMRCTLQLQVP